MKLKRFIGLYTFFLFFGIVTCQSQASIPKVEKIYKNVPELIIKDSLFLCGIDSLIFKSICPEIKEKELKFFIIDSYEKKDSIYLSFCLASYFEYSGHNHLKGYFKYKDYTFIWFGDIPQFLYTTSNKKKKFGYLKGTPPIVSDYASFMFIYTRGKLELTGMCCY